MFAGSVSTGRAAFPAALLLGIVLAAPTLHAEPPAATPVAVQNCVGSDTIELRAGEDSMLLDDADRDAMVTDMLKRYPVLGRDGFVPAAVLLWRKPGSGWVYVALRRQADKPGGVCALASFSAAAFELTAPLLRKYFVIAPGRS